ncbi:MAG: hypothetical protein M1816_000814 [Peltula sp. TS41687]|nr:MAG: hypothetical protein M1816_000814 [Peltula sp. TS41687]
MTSFRPNTDRTSTGDSYRPLLPSTSAGRDTYHTDRPSRSDGHGSGQRSPPVSERHSPAHDSSRAPRAPAASDMTSGREWDIRRDRDFARERDYDERDRSLSPRRKRRGRYRDWDQEDHLSRDYSRSRSGSRSRVRRRSRSPYYGGPASRDVILEGLPVEMESDDVGHHPPFHAPISSTNSRSLSLLQNINLQGYHVEGLDEVRVIKDRQTGLSRQFGFLHFISVGAARDFLEQNYPSVYLYGNGTGNRKGSRGDQATKVRISFCRERDDRDRGGKTEDEWECQVNVADVLIQEPVYRYTNTGDSDVSPDGTPSQFLLFRGLEPTVTTQLLAKGAAKLYKSSGGTPPPQASSSKKTGAKVSSTTADSNLGAKEGSLRRVLLVKDRRTDESWRYGFVEFASVEASDSQAALTKFNSLDKFTISSKPVLLSFVHSGVFVPMLKYTPALERFTFSPLSNPSMKLAYWDEEAYVSELMLASEDNEPDLNSNERISTGKVLGAAGSEKEASLKSTKQSDNKNKKRKAEDSSAASNKKAVPAHLNFWRNRHAELHGIQTEDSDQALSDSNSTAANQVSDPVETAPPTRSYADTKRNCCLLCSRQFKTTAEVNKHERLSQLHRDNLKDDDLKAKALARLAKAGVGNTSDEPAYRDRAKERRTAFNQPKRPVPDSGSSRPSATHQQQEEEPQPVIQSKGAALLGKMGWTAGEGLGAQGTGIVAPVATEMYVQGVGLGAEGGKVGDAVEEAQRNTGGGYDRFLERTKDKAKERFHSLG